MKSFGKKLAVRGISAVTDMAKRFGTRLILTSCLVFGTSALAAPKMTCVIRRPGIPNAIQESVMVEFLTPYERDFPEQKTLLFIGFYEGLMQINLYERTVAGSLENIASARTHDFNSNVWLTSRRWRLDVQCERVESE